MKIKLQLIAAVLAAGAFAACDAARTVSPTAPAEASDDLRRRVEALGFRGDMVKDFGSYVLVEGDITLPKSRLASPGEVRIASVPGGPRFQYRTSSIVGTTKVEQIRVDVSGLASVPAWQTAARSALTQWNGVPNTLIKLVEGSPADISLSTECSSVPGLVARSDWPANGNPGTFVIVNTCLTTTLNDAQRLRNVVHELGHALGFRHSNWVQTDCDQPGWDTNCSSDPAPATGAILIPGTPTSGNDAASVMNGQTGLTAWGGFSYYDQVAARSLYPLLQPNATLGNAGGSTVVSWPAASGASYYEIERYEYSTHSWGGSDGIEFGWEPVYGTSYSTGNTWTGVSQCTYYDNGPNPNSDFFYWRVRSVSPGGKRSDYTQIEAQDGVC